MAEAFTHLAAMAEVIEAARDAAAAEREAAEPGTGRVFVDEIANHDSTDAARGFVESLLASLAEMRQGESRDHPA